MDIWYWMPDYASFITVEDFEFVFLGSSPAFWNFLYSTQSAASDEWQWLVSTRMYQHAYGVETDAYLMLKTWLGFLPREIYDGAHGHNLRWRGTYDSSGTVELSVRGLTIFSAFAIKVWCHLYFYITTPFKEVLAGFPTVFVIGLVPGTIFICVPFSFFINYFSYFNKVRKDNFYLNYIKYLKKHYEHVNKK